MPALGANALDPVAGPDHNDRITSLLGLVKHLTDVERFWFQAVWVGSDIEFHWTADDPDGDGLTGIG